MEYDARPKKLITIIIMVCIFLQFLLLVLGIVLIVRNEL